jgi:hypothetical protein
LITAAFPIPHRNPVVLQFPATVGYQSSENRVLGRIFEKRDEVTEGWRKLLIEELCNLYSLPNIIRMNKSRRMR